MKWVRNSKTAVIVLHEIYGVNQFIKKCGEELHKEGLDIYCPDLLEGKQFSYAESEEAYQYFKNIIGFQDASKKTMDLIIEIKKKYDTIILLGYSIGATIAWLCNQTKVCNGIICYYGSRIRDYVDVEPSCPNILFFAANESSFNTLELIETLQSQKNIRILKSFDAHHGFADPNNNAFNSDYAQQCWNTVVKFIQDIKEKSHEL